VTGRVDICGAALVAQAVVGDVVFLAVRLISQTEYIGFARNATQS
jgi:hypothetical protein